MREDRRHSATVGIGETKMAFVLTQNLGLSTQDFYALCDTCDTICRVMPILHGEKQVRIVVRVMAWHFAPQKVGACDNTATIRPSKSGHKTTPCDAHSVAANQKGAYRPS